MVGRNLRVRHDHCPAADGLLARERRRRVHRQPAPESLGLGRVCQLWPAIRGHMVPVRLELLVFLFLRICERARFLHPHLPMDALPVQEGES